MRTSPITSSDLRGVFAVPPLARREDGKRSIDFQQNDRIVRHIVSGGVTRLLYGGNAFLYHVTLREFETLLGWLSGLPDDLWLIPSIGPSFGHALDQAALLKRYRFPCVMMLPCGDPRDASGLERGYREIADRSETRLLLYIREENNLGGDKEAGLDVVARLIGDGLCEAVKYAVVREDPLHDSYLDSLLTRVDRKFVISGMGERPAVVHMRDWGLPGFTTGSGCIAPALTQRIFEACTFGKFDQASHVRERFMPLEDLRDAWGPARVLHYAVELAGIASTGPVIPFVSPLMSGQIEQLTSVARSLMQVF